MLLSHGSKRQKKILFKISDGTKIGLEKHPDGSTSTYTQMLILSGPMPEWRFIFGRNFLIQFHGFEVSLYFSSFKN